MQLPHSNKPYKPIYNHLELFFNSLQSNEDNLIYFLQKLGQWEKMNFFCAGRAVFSCMVLSIVENISLSVPSILY